MMCLEEGEDNMGGGGSNSYTTTPLDINHDQMKQFVQSGQGQQYAPLYDPNQVYYGINGQSGIYAQVPGSKQKGINVDDMIHAFSVWQTGDNATKASWQNYAALANANSGGEGDQTITTGAALGQRQALLGAMGNPTQGTPGIPDNSLMAQLVTKNKNVLGVMSK